MKIIESVIDFVFEHRVVILGALFAVSEVLALIPGVKSNSVFQLIWRVILKLLGKSPVENPAPAKKEEGNS